MRDLANVVGEYWAEVCLEEAEKGAEHPELKRCFDVAVNAGADEDHPKLLRAIKIINDRLADKVLKDAQHAISSDKAMADQGRTPQVGMATAKADTIDNAVKEAKEIGVNPRDLRLAEALDIAQELREVDGARKRVAGAKARKLAREHA